MEARSTDLATNILENTKSALADSLQTKFAIAQTQQKVLNDNLIRETRLYGRLSAAGSPLTSLTIKLRIGHLSSHLMSQIQDGIQDGMSIAESERYEDYIAHHEENYAEEMIDSLFARKVVQPLISLLASNQFIQHEEGMLVFGFDKGFTAIACLGWLTKPDAFPVEDGKSLLPSGVVLADNLDERNSRFPRAQRPIVNIALEKIQ